MPCSANQGFLIAATGPACCDCLHDMHLYIGYASMTSGLGKQVRMNTNLQLSLPWCLIRWVLVRAVDLQAGYPGVQHTGVPARKHVCVIYAYTIMLLMLLMM